MSDKKKRYEIIEENDKTISICILSNNEIKVYKKITNDDIKCMLAKDQDINLEECYIKDFSYRFICNLPSNFEILEELQSERKILKNFAASDAFFDGNVDFSYARFGDGTVDFSSAYFGDGNVFFSNAQFGKGNVDFSFTHFGAGNVIFSDATFGDGNVLFAFMSFGEGVVDFSDTQFGKGNVDFSYANFGVGDVYFCRADFGEGNVIFSDAAFDKGMVCFSDALFGKGNVDFSNTDFGEGDVDFIHSIFKGGIFTFQSINNIGQLHFNILSSVDTIFFFDSCCFSSPVFININFIKFLILYNCIFSSLLSLDSSDFGDFNNKQIALFKMTNFGTIKLDWEKAKNSIIHFDMANFPREEDLNLPEILVYLLYDKKKLNKLICEELSLIKENYHNKGRYDWEDDVYVSFKWIETKNMLTPSTENPINYLLRLIFKFPVMVILYSLGRYGTDPFSILIYMLCVLVIFSLLYCYEWASIFPNIMACKPWSPFYYSAITFFTVGYGDLWSQTGWAAVLCALESFLGVFLMGYFSVALVRKILR